VIKRPPEEDPVGSHETGPESFEHIVTKAVDLMSMVSQKASNDLKDFLPGEDALGRARTTAGNVRDASESLLRLGALAGQLFVDAAARVTQEVAVPLLEDPSPPAARKMPATSPSDLLIAAAAGKSGSAPVCVYNSGAGATIDLQFSATPLSRFEAGDDIPADNISCTPSKPSLESAEWTNATVVVEVPQSAPQGEYLGYLHVHATDRIGGAATAGHIALRVTVVAPGTGDGGTAAPGPAGPA
jgi:hypothetical protein